MTEKEKRWERKEQRSKHSCATRSSSTVAMIGASILIFAGLFLPDIDCLDFQSVSSDEFPECKTDLLKIGKALENQEMWALKIVDASTKIPAGILTGHLTDYGNFDECLENGGDVRTHHCVASIEYRFPGNELRNRTEGNASLKLRWSYCLPVSCPARFLESFIGEVVPEGNSNVSVSESDCISNDRKSVTFGDFVGIGIWSFFVGLAVVSTIYDVVVERTGAKRNPWLSSFSVYTNGKNLLKTETTPDTMTPLHGLRFLSICWVLLGHRFFFTLSSSLINLTDFAKELEMVRSQFFIQGVLAVDTFFLLSGLLNCFLLLKVLDKVNRFPVWRYYLHRYIRLTPVLAAIVLMYATWYTLLGDGPVWNQTTTIWKELCVDNWWPTLLYINNYYNPVSQCAGQSWYLAVDMQLYWLSPLVVVPLWKRPRLGRVLMWVLLLLSVVSQFAVAFVYKFRMSFTFGLNQEEFEEMTRVLYVPTHMRATPYVMGLMIGHFLYRLKKRKMSLQLSQGFVWFAWIMSTGVALGVVFGNFQLSRPVKDHPYDRWESSVYIALHRFAWGASLGWIIISCLNNKGGFVNGILSWKAFIPLSRLTYCIFLCHMAIQQYQIGTARTSDYFQYFNQIHRYFGDLLFSVLAAAALSLVFESPILVLEKLAEGRRAPERKDLKSEVNAGFQDDASPS